MGTDYRSLPPLSQVDCPGTSRIGASGKRCFPSAAQNYRNIAGVSLIPVEQPDWDRPPAQGQGRAGLGNSPLVTQGQASLTASGRTECYEFEIYQPKQGHKSAEKRLPDRGRMSVRSSGHGASRDVHSSSPHRKLGFGSRAVAVAAALAKGSWSGWVPLQSHAQAAAKSLLPLSVPRGKPAGSSWAWLTAQLCL